ncbi:MAG: hypothetical protein NZ928_00180 [Endomicrobia bacterium]|nr:hypothetical protein [Endomicrobiia bacterium]
MIKKFYDPYIEVIRKFNSKKVKYVVIGVAGINYYVKDVRQLFVTADFDVFISPEEQNLNKALQAIKELKFDIIWQKRHLREMEKKLLKEILRKRTPILCVDPFYNLVVELFLEVSGFTFENLYSDKEIFYAGNVKINVGRLEKLLMVKKFAARQKDVDFLKKYKIIFKQQL